MKTFTIYGIGNCKDECYGSYNAVSPEGALLNFVLTQALCVLKDGVFIFANPDDEEQFLSENSTTGKLTIADWRIVEEAQQ